MAVTKFIFAFLFLLAQAVCEDVEAPPIFSHVGGNGNGAAKGCRYEFTVPDKAGMCSTGNAALESKIDKVKDDLDRTRLQYVSQHTIVQDQLSKVQNNVNNYGSQVNDLYKHLRQLESQLGHISNSNRLTSNGDLEKLVERTKDTFNQALYEMGNKLFNISMNLQKDAIEQSKVNAAIEMQVRMQDERMKQFEEKLKDALKIASGSTGSTGHSSPTSNANPAMLKQVSDRLKHFEEQIQMYDQLAQQQYSALQAKSNEVALKVSNHSHQLSNIGLRSEVALSRVQGAENKIDKISLDFSDFKKKTEPKIADLVSDMRDVQSDTTDLKSEINKVASKAMDADVHSLQGASSISDLKVRIQLLTMRITGILSQLTNQSMNIEHLSNDLQSLSSNLDPTQVQKMKDALVALQNTGALGSVTQAQLQQVENEIHKLDTIVSSLQQKQTLAASGTTESTTLKAPAAQTTAKPIHVPTTKVPVMKTTVKPMKVPTPKAPVMQTTAKPFQVPTVKAPIMKTTTKSMKVPSMKVPTLQTTPKPFRIPTLKVPTAKETPKFKIPTPPAKSPVLGPVQIHVPTPPAFKVPSLPGNNKK